jgi:hypothetical protein
MADSINPADLPPGMDAYAGYDNGKWPDYQAIAKAHPGAHLLDFTVFMANTGTGGDFELGDMPASDAVPYAQERLAARIWRPVEYASIGGEMIQIVANLHAAGIALSSVRLLSAHYGAGQHICGPTTCRLGAAATTQMDGTQWIDHGPWDESLLLDSFFPTAPVFSPPPVGTTISIAANLGGPMNRTIIDVPTDEHGNGCLVLDGGTNSQPGITSSPTAIMSPAIVSVDKWGSNPVANGYWPGDVGWQDHAGHPYSPSPALKPSLSSLWRSPRRRSDQ